MTPVSGESKAGFNAMLIVVVLALIVLAVASWLMMQDATVTVPVSETPTTGAMITEEDVTTQQMKTQGTSDNMTEIEADLNATNMNSLEEINQI